MQLRPGGGPGWLAGGVGGGGGGGGVVFAAMLSKKGLHVRPCGQARPPLVCLHWGMHLMVLWSGQGGSCEAPDEVGDLRASGDLRLCCCAW